MTLGYIVTDKKIKEKLDYIDIIQPKNYVESEIHLPTLIIGFDNARNFLGDRFNILENQVNDNLYWTFWKTEKHTIYDRVLSKFYEDVFNGLKNQVKYQSISLFRLSLSSIKRLVNLLRKQKNYIYIGYKTLYVYNPNNKNNTIFGISFDELDYVGIKKDKVVSKILDMSNNVIEKNDYFLSNNIKNILKSSKFIYPYLIYLLKKDD